MILLSGQFHKFGRGGVGVIAVHVERVACKEGGLPRVWHRLTLFVFLLNTFSRAVRVPYHTFLGPP